MVGNPLKIVARRATIVMLFGVSAYCCGAKEMGDVPSYVSVLGDPGMKGTDATAVTWSGWNFCNGARQPPEFDHLTRPRSPRMADCLIHGVQRISEADNQVGPPDPLPDVDHKHQNHLFVTTNPDWYARQKENRLAEKCAHRGLSLTVSGWHVMFKSGNMNDLDRICPCSALPPHRCPHMYKGPGEMNQPIVAHAETESSQREYFGIGCYVGTYDVDPAWTEKDVADVQDSLLSYARAWLLHRQQERQGKRPFQEPDVPPLLAGASILFTIWSRVPDGSFNHTNATKLSFYQGLKTSHGYPWLMNYLRSNQVQPDKGGYGGYPWGGGFGMMERPVGTYGTLGTARLRVTLRLLQSSPDAKNQFYLPEWGGCWKLDGSPCNDHDLSVDWPKQDVTRYICFLAVSSSKIHSGCGPSPEHQKKCPPYHILSPQPPPQNHTSAPPPHAGIKVYRNDSKRFPYHCYFLHCYAPNDPTAPAGETCDPYSNPNPQEIMQLLPCEEWAIHQFPTEPLGTANNWYDDGTARETWDLDVGSLGARVFLQGQEPPLAWKKEDDDDDDENNEPLPDGYVLYPGWNRRTWLSFEIGPEQMDSQGHFVRWEVEDWDVKIPAGVVAAESQHFQKASS